MLKAKELAWMLRIFLEKFRTRLLFADAPVQLPKLAKLQGSSSYLRYFKILHLALASESPIEKTNYLGSN